MKVLIDKNRIYFNENDKAFANISIKKKVLTLELIKVPNKFRKKHLASKLMKDVLLFIKNNLSDKRKLILNPLPLDSTGLKLDALICFYKNFGFKNSKSHTLSDPYKMIKVL